MAKKEPSIAELHAILRGNYKARWDEDADRAAKVTLEAMVKEKGLERTSAAVHNCIRYETFFEATKLWQHVPEVRSDRPRCDRCRDNEGWIYVMAEGEKGWRVYRCIHDAPQACRMITIREKISGEMRVLKAVDCDYADSQPVGAYRDPSEAGA